MKFKNLLFTIISSLVLISNASGQSQKKEIDSEDYKGIILSLINVNNQTLEINNRLIKSINGIYLKLHYLQQDPKSVKTAKEIIPINNKVRSLSNRTDDKILAELNYLIQKEEEVSGWFVKNDKEETLQQFSFFALKRIDSPKWTAQLLGIDKLSAINKANIIRQYLVDYRNELILAIGDSIKNDRNQLKYISIDKLIDFETFQSHLVSINHPNKNELLGIYSDLTIPETIQFAEGEIPWNRITFHNQPLIGAIATLNSYRNKIRFSQETASKILLSRIEIPLKPLHEYQK